MKKVVNILLIFSLLVGVVVFIVIYNKKSISFKNVDDNKNVFVDYTDEKFISKDYSNIRFNYKVKVKKREILYKDKGDKLILDSNVVLPLLYEDESYYYVIYKSKTYYLDKSKATLINISSEDNDEFENIKSISVIHYKDITDEYEKDNIGSISVENLEKNLSTLKEKNFYSINEYEYLGWLKGYIYLNKNAIFMITDDDNYDSIFDKYEFSIVSRSSLKNKYDLLDNNEVSSIDSDISKINNYVVSNNTSLSDMKKIFEGKKVITLSEKDDIAKEIPVLNYHFFYNEALKEKCNELICLDEVKFEEHLKYLVENNYKALSIDEYADWIYGKIELPKKSVLLTIDDGACGTGTKNGNILIPLLEKYNVNATLFLVSGWWSPDNYRFEYLDIQSHTSNMHKGTRCSTGEFGSQLTCSSYEEILADLTNSLKDVDSNTSFCYPFYKYNDKVIKAVKEKGFKIAFAGGNINSSRNSDKYKIPRYVIHDSITINQFISYIST